MKSGYIEMKDLIIDVTNIGKKPATNLTLTVKTNENIPVPVNYSIFDTQNNISSLELYSKSIQINFPRLVQGNGSIIRLNLENIPTNHIDNVYAVYDQGSTSYKEITERSWYIGSVSIWFIVIWVGLVFIIYSIYSLNRKRKQKKKDREKEQSYKQNQEKERKDFLQKILTHMINIRNTLSNDLNTKASFEEEEKFWDNKQLDEKLHLMNDIGDLITIDNFYRELKRHNISLHEIFGSKMTIKGQPNKNIENGEQIEKHIKKDNEKCLRSVDNVLNTIDWSKYNILYRNT